MRWIWRLYLWQIAKKKAVNGALSMDRDVSVHKAEFATRYREVRGACALLEQSAHVSSLRLGAAYMNQVLSGENDPAWWRENGEDADKPWFIWTYGVEHGLIAPPVPCAAPPEWHVIRPEGQEKADFARITLHRRTDNAAEGRVRMAYSRADKPFRQWLYARGYRWSQIGYEREIDEMSAPIEDRAVELCTQLLQRGCGVCVEESRLERRILEARFEPEHLRWVYAAPQQDRLFLKYPHDPVLHGYVRRAGGRWDGAHMQISVCDADRLEELIRLYGFRATREARHRLDLWQKAVLSATIFRQRNGKTRPASAPPEDRFRMLLDQEAIIPEDLREVEDE